jgi:hypothetical protein
MMDETAVNFLHHSYDRDNDSHVRAIDRLVHELGVSPEEVNKSYREVLSELQKDGTVKFFLPIPVSGVVKARFLEEQSPCKNGRSSNPQPEKNYEGNGA